MSDLNEFEFCDQRGDRDVRSVGPFKRFPVVVNGWTVPYLQARYIVDSEPSMVWLTLDNRLSVDVPADLAGQVIGFVADAIALGMGYPCHPRSSDTPSVPKLPWRRLSAWPGATDG